jgi:HSP20 family protein
MARERGLAKREQGELARVEPWDSFGEMERMMREFFNYPFPSMFRPTRAWQSIFRSEFTPEVDLKETDKEYVLSATIPGLEKDDVNIDVTKDSISISGERRTEEERPGERYHVRQQSCGSFRVNYSLPSEVKPDDVKAVYRNGILEVAMPKAEVTAAHKVKVDVK